MRRRRARVVRRRARGGQVDERAEADAHVQEEPRRRQEVRAQDRGVPGRRRLARELQVEAAVAGHEVQSARHPPPRTRGRHEACPRGGRRDVAQEAPRREGVPRIQGVPPAQDVGGPQPLREGASVLRGPSRQLRDELGIPEARRVRRSQALRPGNGRRGGARRHRRRAAPRHRDLGRHRPVRQGADRLLQPRHRPQPRVGRQERRDAQANLC